MKTRDELCALKEEREELNEKLKELSEEELAQVSGGRSVSEVLADMNSLQSEALLNDRMNPPTGATPAECDCKASAL